MHKFHWFSPLWGGGWYRVLQDVNLWWKVSKMCPHFEKLLYLNKTKQNNLFIAMLTVFSLLVDQTSVAEMSPNLTGPLMVVSWQIICCWNVADRKCVNVFIDVNWPNVSCWNATRFDRSIDSCMLAKRLLLKCRRLKLSTAFKFVLMMVDKAYGVEMSLINIVFECSLMFVDKTYIFKMSTDFKCSLHLTASWQQIL